MISETDYAHAVNVWQRFFIRTLSKYIWKQMFCYWPTFSKISATVASRVTDSILYALRITSYQTSRAMLKHTGVRFELLTDIDMIIFIKHGIRSGLNQCSTSVQTRANNKICRHIIHRNRHRTWCTSIMMSTICTVGQCANHYLTPILDRRWIDHIQNFDFITIALDSPTSYIHKIDMEYLQHLHDTHTDRSVRRARNHPASAMTNSSQHYAINSVTSQSAATYSSRPSYRKGSPYIAIRAISVIVRLHWA